MQAELGRHGDALELADSLLEGQPFSMPLLQAAAAAELGLGRWEAALARMRALLGGAGGPSLPRWSRRQLLMGEAAALERLERLDEAAGGLLVGCAGFAPADPVAFELCRLLRAAGRTDQAATVWSEHRAAGVAVALPRSSHAPPLEQRAPPSQEQLAEMDAFATKLAAEMSPQRLRLLLM